MSIKTVNVPSTLLEKGQFLLILNKHYYKVAVAPIAAVDKTDTTEAILEVPGSARLIRNISNSTQKTMILHAHAQYAVCDVNDIEELYRRTRAQPRMTRAMVTTAQSIDRSARHAENLATEQTAQVDSIQEDAIKEEKVSELESNSGANDPEIPATTSGVDPVIPQSVEEGQSQSILQQLTDKHS